MDMPLNTIQYDQGVTRYDGGSVNGRIYQAIDMDFLKMNLSHFILKSSWVDLVSGLNVRYANIIAPNSLPISEWGQTNPTWNTGSKLFSPRIISFGMTHSLNIQWFESWFFQTNYTFGFATSKFYQTPDSPLDDTPSGWGTSVSYSTGVAYVLDPGLDNRFSVGIEFHGGYTRINRISDDSDLTPIKGFFLNDIGLRLSLSAFYGGNRTSGDLAKSYFYRGDYVTSREQFAEFIKEYPTHANRYRAEQFLEACNILIPEQLFLEGKQFEERSVWDKAVERFQRARMLTRNPDLVEAVDHHLKRIARLQLHEAESLLEGNAEKDAYEIVLKTSTYSEEAKTEINRFHAELLLAEAKKAMDHDLIYKSLELIDKALTIYPDFSAKTSALRYQAASLLITHANSATSTDDIQYAIYSLENAKRITGDLGEKNEAILSELRDRLSMIDDQETRKNIAQITNKERTRLEASLQKRIELGMTVPDIQIRLGEPHEVQKELHDGEHIELWIYHLKNGNDLFLSFKEFILFKIEEK